MTGSQQYACGLLILLLAAILTDVSHQARSFLLLWTPSSSPRLAQGAQRAARCTQDQDPSNGGGVSEKTCARRSYLQKVPLAVVGCIATAFPGQGRPAGAAGDDRPTREMVSLSFDSIRYEWMNPKGGLAYIQEKIDQRDWEGLMAFTQTYDLQLRKLRMGQAKKLLQDKEIKAKATEYANAVTFDLIGINRSSRKGQEDADSANKYLQELRDDVENFLTLEKTIHVRE